MVENAWLSVKSNGGVSGADNVSIKDFESDLDKNLYKIWNRMTSGSYFPPAVKRVYIPKGKSKKKTRPLGVPSVGDRVAQTVVKNYLEPLLDPVFDVYSFGFRPNRSAHQALLQARKMCHQYPWVVDFDIASFFDNVDHELLLKALGVHCKEKWVNMYVERWLKAPIQEKGKLSYPTKGLAQGGIISPLLANLFLHYAFDKWMRRTFPNTPFERYADDGIVHAHTQKEAETILSELRKRFQEIGLTIHPDKSKIVYCKHARRTLNYPIVSFTFLGYTFRPRKSFNKRTRKVFVGFDFGISNQAKRKITRIIRSIKIPHASQYTIEQLAEILNPKITGWLNYYGKFKPYLMRILWIRLNRTLFRWARKRYKSCRGAYKKAIKWMKKQYQQRPTLFKHWEIGVIP